MEDNRSFLKDNSSLDDNEVVDQQELENINGGDDVYCPDVVFAVDVINGKIHRREIFDTHQYYQIATIKKWIKEREKLGPCDIRIYNAANVELVDGSLKTNKIKTGDVLTGIVSNLQ